MTTEFAEHRFDAFDAHCPSRPLLDTIGDKWGGRGRSSRATRGHELSPPAARMER